jgi:hypothetical protein
MHLVKYKCRLWLMCEIYQHMVIVVVIVAIVVVSVVNCSCDCCKL